MGAGDAMDNTGDGETLEYIDLRLDAAPEAAIAGRATARGSAASTGAPDATMSASPICSSATFPFVAFSGRETSGAFPFVDIDHHVVGGAGCARFIAMGHRRIAFVSSTRIIGCSARGFIRAECLRCASCRTIFGLMAATGPRISEATRLTRLDVDLEQRLPHIRCTKFDKSRWMPMHPTTAVSDATLGPQAQPRFLNKIRRMQAYKARATLRDSNA